MASRVLELPEGMWPNGEMRYIPAAVGVDKSSLNQFVDDMLYLLRWEWHGGKLPAAAEEDQFLDLTVNGIAVSGQLVHVFIAGAIIVEISSVPQQQYEALIATLEIEFDAAVYVVISPTECDQAIMVHYDPTDLQAPYKTDPPPAVLAYSYRKLPA